MNMDIQWPLPAQWSDFEELCYRLMIAENKLFAPYRYGRKGQRQFGIDVAGVRRSSRSEWEGIQCKLKTEHLGGQLSEKEIYDTIDLAKEYPQELVYITFATTAARDTTARNAADRVNSSAHKRLDVGIWFWEDIVDLMNQHKEVARRFYPQFFPQIHVSHTESGGVESHFYAHQPSKDRHERFIEISRQPIFQALGHVSSRILSVAVEFVENVLDINKGKATRVALEYDGTELRLSDNGRAFNPLTNQPSREGQEGLRAIKELGEFDGIGLSYSARDDDEGHCVNILTIDLSLLKRFDSAISTCIAYTDSLSLYDRDSGFRAANSIEIPETCDPFVVRIGGARILSKSTASQFVTDLARRLGERKLRIVVAAHRSDLFEMLARYSLDNLDVVQDA